MKFADGMDGRLAIEGPELGARVRFDGMKDAVVIANIDDAVHHRRPG